MNRLEISKSSSAKTEFSFISVFFRRFLVFSVFFNTDVGVGFGFFLNIAISVSVFGYRLGSTAHYGLRNAKLVNRGSKKNR